MADKTIQLQPEKSYHFWWYVAGVLLIPLLIGIYILYKKISDLSSVHYKITDRTITAVNPGYTENADIENITDVMVHQRWIDKKFGIGNLTLITHSKKIELVGLKNPDPLAEMIRKAAKSERVRLREKEKREKEQPSHGPGMLDKLDYLTGLWQQGLISNDDYLKEKKHFEDN